MTHRNKTLFAEKKYTADFFLQVWTYLCHWLQIYWCPEFHWNVYNDFQWKLTTEPQVFFNLECVCQDTITKFCYWYKFDETFPKKFSLNISLTSIPFQNGNFKIRGNLKKKTHFLGSFSETNLALIEDDFTVSPLKKHLELRVAVVRLNDAKRTAISDVTSTTKSHSFYQLWRRKWYLIESKAFLGVALRRSFPTYFQLLYYSVELFRHFQQH